MTSFSNNKSDEGSKKIFLRHEDPPINEYVLNDFYILNNTGFEKKSCVYVKFV